MALKYKHRLLFVDDEPSITKSLQRLFRREGYEISTALSGKQGLEKLKEAEKPFSLIISDQRMPGMTGAQFLEKAKKIFPNAMRILLTGYSDMDAIVDAINKGGIHRYFTKPWNDQDLLSQVRQSLEQYELVLENRRLLALTKKQNKELNELNKHLERKVAERSRQIIEKNKELSRINRELESSLYNSVRAFAALTEIHAPSLAGHGRRVGAFSHQIARLLGLSENEVTHIEIAGLLHDIGKLGFPQKLLERKETKWSDQDRELFRKHPELGQSTVQFIKKLDHVGILIRSHHEQYDGHGYPDQLAEEEIPLGSRIIAVADAYDNIVNLKLHADRSFKTVTRESKITQDHLSEGEVLQKAAILHLKQYAFTRYDPDVVKVFLELLKTRGIFYAGEKRLSVESLKEGMVLSRPLYSSTGRFLLPHNTTLTADHIQKLRTLNKTDPIKDTIYVRGK
ncbi:MAG: two-component system response regulator [Deltaproteobacteria bacterium]|nr:MAG: two-component system response regulator [Deltaproteobacteria bacterium]